MESFNSTEEEDNWVYSYDKNKSLVDQAICKTNHGYIIGILKQYTNDVYFGSNFFELSKKDQKIYCHFKCKDRGLTQEIVDDKNNFISFISNIGWKPLESSVFFKIEKESPFPDFKLFYVFDNSNNYQYSLLTGIEGSFKGCYSTEPTLNELLNFKQNFNNSFSNNITRENVIYSDIKIYHKSET